MYKTNINPYTPKISPLAPSPIFAILVFLLLPFLGACKPNTKVNSRETPAQEISPVDQRDNNIGARQQNQPTIDSTYVEEYISQERAFRHYQDLVMEFYQDRDFSLAWFQHNKLVPQARKLIEVLEKAHREGLDPKDYQIKDFQALIKNYEQANGDPGRKLRLQQELDMALTASYFNYASDFYKGSVDPHSTARIEWEVKKNKVKLHKALQTILEERESTYPYYEFEALHEGYQKLREVLVKYRQIQDRGGWPAVEDQGLVKSGDTAMVVLQVRQRLMPQQNVNAADTSMMVYDYQIEQAVKDFQRQHGLKPDGVVGPNTYKVLNVPVEERIDQIVLNMERWRWLPKRLVPKGLPDRYVFVNIPAYELKVVENGNKVMDMKVVVGKTMHSTPVFSHQIDYIEFAPYWNVPNSIIMAEFKPKMQRNINWLETQDMEMVTTFGPDAQVVSPRRVNWYTVNENNFKYRIRQRPGPNNSLGRVKFIFPNEYAVYLHDTPADHLFNMTDRDFSHGCVRVERPADLAEFLLKDQPQWTESRISTVMNGTSVERVPLNQKVPVYLVYFTAFVDDEGVVQFRDDIYGHDQALAQELF